MQYSNPIVPVCKLCHSAEDFRIISGAKTLQQWSVLLMLFCYSNVGFLKEWGGKKWRYDHEKNVWTWYCKGFLHVCSWDPNLSSQTRTDIFLSQTSIELCSPKSMCLSCFKLISYHLTNGEVHRPSIGFTTRKLAGGASTCDRLGGWLRSAGVQGQWLRLLIVFHFGKIINCAKTCKDSWQIFPWSLDKSCAWIPCMFVPTLPFLAQP